MFRPTSALTASALATMATMATALMVTTTLSVTAAQAAPTGDSAGPNSASPRYRLADAPDASIPLGRGSAQTSDREPGWLVPDGSQTAEASGFSAHERATTSPDRSGKKKPPKPPPVDLNKVAFPVASGATYQRWDRLDSRGQQRIHVLSVDLTQKGVRLDQIDAPTVPARDRMKRLVTKSGAFAGVNGDFFDISDTGAALGVAATRKGGIRQGRVQGWNSTFYQVNGSYRIGELPLVAKVKNRPNVVITHVNSPQIDPHGLGVYTSQWGTTSGARVLPWGVKRTREVVIRGGKVRSNKRKLSTGTPIRGRVLVGTGRSVDQLKKLKVGKKIAVRFRLKGRPKMAISGDRPLLLASQRVVVDDMIMHPRTAVGIDQDGKQLFFVTIDGRQSFSRGATMVELANLMTELGAEDALNLDGGGSTTMVAPNRSGAVTVRNSPSDGQQRLVPNGIGLFAR